MESPKQAHLSNRVLKINVGFLLSDGPGTSHKSNLEIPTSVRVADDLDLNYIVGTIRLSRTKEGILVQSNLRVGIDTICDRCLEPTTHDLEIELEELYAHGRVNGSEFVVEQSGILDLAPLLRAEVLMTASGQTLCRPNCKGLCPECGVNMNYEAHDCDLDNVDPRLAVLKQLLNASE